MSLSPQRAAPVCPLGRVAQEMRGCVCAPAAAAGLDGNPRGGCVAPLSDHGVPELEAGWCFLENLQDPANPTQDCYEDTQFSVADGRFWSNLACIEKQEEEKRKSSLIIVVYI